MRKILLALVLGLLVACGEQATNPMQDFDHSGQQIIVTVIYYETQGELERAAMDILGGLRSIELEGFAVWPQIDFEPYTCDIHVMRPKNIDDQHDMFIAGHELTHCVFGRFHKD